MKSTVILYLAFVIVYGVISQKVLRRFPKEKITLPFVAVYATVSFLIASLIVFLLLFQAEPLGEFLLFGMAPQLVIFFIPFVQGHLIAHSKQ